MVNKQIVLLVIGVAVLKCIDSQVLPANPCPNLFQYFRDNGVIYGRLEFPNDFSGYYQLVVNMSVATYLTDNKNIRLELRSSENDLSLGKPVLYNIYFPIQAVIPKPTRIEFNNRVYCSGPPEELRPGGGVTNMWANTYFRLAGPVRATRPNSVNEIQIVEAVPQFSFTIGSVPNFFQPSSTERPAWATQFAAIPTQPPTVAAPPTPTQSSAPVAPFTSMTNPSIAPPKAPQPETSIIDRNPSFSECGLSSVQLVVNGEEVQDGQYPWMVALMHRIKSDYKYRCTGSLVSSRHVITAGHCVQFFKSPLVPIEDLLLVFGKNNIQNWANGAVIRDVQNMTVHPDYRQNKGDGDIAVLTMSKPVEFEAFVRPVCLWQDDEDLDLIVGKEGTVVGWGRDETGKDFVTEAKKINLPIVSQVTCLRSDPGFSDITSSKTFCAGNRDGSGPCTGDSGAGFIMNRSGKWMLRGVVSTALGDSSTCDLNNYFVFADVAKVTSWIRKAMA